MSLYEELAKYQGILSDINSARYQIDELKSHVEALKGDLTENFNIDYRALDEDEINSIINELSEANGSLSSNASAVERKIDSIKEEIRRKEEEERRRREQQERDEREREKAARAKND